ncbi:MAG: hypothetical protein PHQ21_03440 [Firmicutes bacterium]|jgi:hypothetical protein|nr:hypothetical protein [Bacillota bacterium]
MYVPPSTGALFLGALLIGLEYWMKSFVSGLPKIAGRQDGKTYWVLRVCSWVAATVLLGLVFGFDEWAPLLALAYAAIASIERPLARLQRRLAALTGSRLPWLQILPMLLLAVFATFASGLACSLSELLGELIAALVWLVPALGGSAVCRQRIIEYAAVYILVSQPANHLIRTLLGRGFDVESEVMHWGQAGESADSATLSSFSEFAECGNVYADAQTLRAGRVIGILERWMIVTFVVLNQFGSIGLILTAKSIVRFSKFDKNPQFAEYYLLGTLYSMTVALLAGLALRG